MRIAAVGDIMCGESFYQYGCGPRTHINNDGDKFLDDKVVEFLASHDLVLGNVETVLSDIGWRAKSLRHHQMRGRPQSAQLLADWGFHVMNVANNHILEHGQEAAVDTVRQLQQAGLAVVGAGKNGMFEGGPAPVEGVWAGQRVAILGACLFQEKYAYAGGSLDACLELIRFLAMRNDLIIASVHWGSEFMDRPHCSQITVARRFVDAGANLVLGHHPHVFQGVHVMDSALVAYSLGNFVFDQVGPDTRWAAILSCRFENGKIDDWKCVPFNLDEKHRPCLVTGNRRGELLTEIHRRHECLNDSTSSDDKTYFCEVSRQRRRFRMSMWWFLFKRFLFFPLWYQMQLLVRPIIRRIGRW